MKYRIGNVKQVLQDKDFEVFVHGCNLQGLFAAGIAGVVRSVYPECYDEYMKGVDSGEYEGGQMIPYEVESGTRYNLDIGLLDPDYFPDYDSALDVVRFDFPGDYKGGNYNITEDEYSSKVILNAFTQIHPGANGSYDLVDKAFATIGRVYDAKISFPLIGCGIAGLNWNIVKEIIDYRLVGKDYECIVRMEDVMKYKLLND